MRYFFLSYAHGSSDHLVEEFFADLSGEVREHAGRERQEEVGFLDRIHLHAGDRWPPTLIEALQTCRTFIALCSPRYFRSVPCGKEWGVFSRRLAADPWPGPPSPALIPLFWLPAEVPAHLSDLQYRDRSFGAPYAEHGLRKLLQLRKYRDDYLEFLASLAIRVTATAHARNPPPLAPPPTFASAVNAFLPAPPERNSPPRSATRPASTRGPRAKLPLVSYDETRDEDGYR
ncbi:TIR-like protein FxsC [Phytohabitans rumicis]|uniref:TIR domain-containing protein n=1 Tax=Phytohabitans rumicis TaxID=1076125 RepID=A0A6V8L3N4_9ACTN|nr:TIR-like protein FxsC [Phytohabitans rumicis]GFJ88687.1 hypothetical protein Prum_023290 [Phytohabitans rumicis]